MRLVMRTPILNATMRSTNDLRFAINVDAVRRARLAVSSKLLALARIVHDKGVPRESKEKRF